MPATLDGKLVIGVTTRALFDLEFENSIFERNLQEYISYQMEHEDEPLKPGPGFSLVRKLLDINRKLGRDLFEVVILSRNSPETGLRSFNTIDHYGLPITRAAFTSGQPLATYLKAFKINLFLSRDPHDVQAAVDQGIAGALLFPSGSEVVDDDGPLRWAFDGDAVVFSGEAEEIFKTKGLEAFIAHERDNARRPLPEGPFGPLLKALSQLSDQFPGDSSPIRIGLFTARDKPAHKRVLLTLRTWGVHIHEVFFLGGLAKGEFLQAFHPHMFFDDQRAHIESAAQFVPAGQVPYPTGTPLNRLQKPETKPEA